MRYRRILSVGLVALACIVPSNLKAADVLSNINESTTLGYGFNPNVRVGLGFSTGPSAGVMDGLALNLMYGTATAPNPSLSITFDVLLYNAAANNLPTGSPIATDTGVTATWTNPTPGQITQQTFTYTGASLPNLFAATLSGSSKYVLVLANNNGTPAFEHYWSAATTNTYTTASGYAFTTMSRSTNGGTSWGSVAFFPIARISVTPVPEPSTLVLSGTTAAMAICNWWRKSRRAS